MAPDDDLPRGRGRPPVGARVEVRLGPLTAQVDDIARAENRTRAHVLRDIIALGLVAYRRRLARAQKKEQS